MDKPDRQYEAPTVTDYGRLRDLTANDGNPVFVDVPQGTPVLGQPIVGEDPNLSN